MKKLVLNLKIVMLISCALIIAGCASDVANRYYGSEHYPPTPLKAVELLYGKPDKKFIVIADFQSRGESYKSLRKKAAEIGANAIIVSSIGGYYSTSEEWAGNDRYKDKYHDHVIGTAIRYIKE
jgi:hypothetical protein